MISLANDPANGKRPAPPPEPPPSSPDARSGTLRDWRRLLLGALVYGAVFHIILSPVEFLAIISAGLSILGVALIAHSLARAPLGRGTLMGAAAYALIAAVGLYWMNHVSVVGYLGLVILFSAYGAAFGAGAVLVRRAAGPWGYIPLLAALWTALELVRARLFTGFPWLLAGTAWTEADTGFADLGGVWAESFILVGVAALAASSVPRKPWRLPVVMGVVIFVFAFGWTRSAFRAEDDSGRVLRVAAVQPLVPYKVGPGANKDKQLARQLAITDGVKPGEIDLLIWSETMVPGDLLERAESLLAKIAVEKKCWVLAGGIVRETGGIETRKYNSAVLIAPDGSLAGRYDKRHLVPFGEYVPLGGRFPGARYIFNKIGTVFTAGAPEQELPRLDGLPLGVSICYEDVFPHLARRDAARGARLLVNLTNDSWFRQSTEARQHLALASFRAVETRRPLIRATNSGISALIEADGSVTVPENGGLWQEGLVRMALRVPEPRRTLYMVVGDLFAWLCVLAAAGGIAVGIVRTRRPD